MNRGRRDALSLGAAAIVFVLSLAAVLGVRSGSSDRLQVSQHVAAIQFTASVPNEAETLAAVPPTVTSPSAIVIEEQSGRVLYERNAYRRRPMASTTKIMTALIVLERLPLETLVLVSPEAAKTAEPSPWLRAGDILTVEELLYALMLRSSNAAAVALAEACCGDTRTFVAEMNRKGAELGLKDTHFMNPHGLDQEGHYSTAADLATLARHAMQNEIFRKLASTKEYVLELPGRNNPIVFKNTNKLLQTVDWVDGVKTGLTPKAEQCLVSSGTRNGVRVISVVLGQPSSAVCWDESQALLEFGLSQYRYVSLLQAGQVLAQARVPYHRGAFVQLVAGAPLSVSAHKSEEVTCSVRIEEPLTVPVATGAKFGEAVAFVGGNRAAAVDVVSAQSYGQTTLGRKVVYVFERLGGTLAGLF
ncbi:MAG: D-alanyl-D-alanine carboxypeptidase [Thermoleophilia bacterium]|nr:D-alanyl-D-alanine carboxypeptidase [Thermoleophilia bacterium]